MIFRNTLYSFLFYQYPTIPMVNIISSCFYYRISIVQKTKIIYTMLFTWFSKNNTNNPDTSLKTW